MIRLLIYGVIFGAIYLGLRRIIKDWRARFSDMDDERKARDQQERKRPDVIELEPDKDGVFRPHSGKQKSKPKDRDPQN